MNVEWRFLAGINLPFLAKKTSGQYIFGKFRLREDENRSEIAQLMPIDPMIYNALKCTLNC